MTGSLRQEGVGGRERLLRGLEKIVLAILLGFFLFHARQFEFIQDDAFITFRYIRNFIGGQGLVFNAGEHVEGYTTLLWTLILTLAAKLGINIVLASRYIGVALGMAALCILFRLSGDVGRSHRRFGFSLIGAGLMVLNGAAAYWSISGMETALFTFLTLLAARAFLNERSGDKFAPWTPLIFILLTLTRPEGMLFFGLTMIFFLFETIPDGEYRAQKLKRLAVWSAMYAIPIGAYTLWRLAYYGYLFPNTFYAKAGFSKELFTGGVDYFWLFAKNYMLGGLLLILPVVVLVRRKWQRDLVYIFFLCAGYTFYVIAVGGDVLPAFRFFVPLLPFLYLFAQEFFVDLFEWARKRGPAPGYLTLLVPIVVGYLTFSIPYEYIREVWMRENALVRKMAQMGRWINEHATPGTVIAASTIGALSYYSEVTVIDMLGLTDETIAHHPESIPGVESNWKERNYNVAYVLSRRPEWICFSTGIKPSAFAERALFTQAEFRRRYYPYYFHPSADAYDIQVMYRRSGISRFDSLATGDARPDNEFINYYYEAMNRKRRDAAGAMDYFRKALAEAPPDFALIYQDMADLFGSQGNDAQALEYYEHALMVDQRMIGSHFQLGYYALHRRDFGTAERHLKEVVQLDPDYSPGWTLLGTVYDSAGDAAQAIRAYRKALQTAANDSTARNSLRNLLDRG